MGWLVFKYLATAAVVVVVSETAKRSDRLGGLLGALPMVTILAMVWLYVEKAPQQKIANHALYTFWYVLPTLPMFIAFPWLLARFGFWSALGAAALLTAAFFLATALLGKQFGLDLL